MLGTEQGQKAVERYSGNTLVFTLLVDLGRADIQSYISIVSTTHAAIISMRGDALSGRARQHDSPLPLAQPPAHQSHGGNATAGNACLYRPREGVRACLRTGERGDVEF
jgi:hypothetical protein